MVSFEGWLLLLSGLALLGNTLNAVPVVGEPLSALGRWLAGFGGLLGALDLLAFFT